MALVFALISYAVFATPFSAVAEGKAGIGGRGERPE